MEAIAEFSAMLTAGGYLALIGFGAYLAYKLALTAVISVSVLKLAVKIVNYAQSRKDAEQKLIQIATSAGMAWPLSMSQWEELNKRVRQ